MGVAEARRAVVRDGGQEDEAGGEWGEKVELVWEFVREAAGLGSDVGGADEDDDDDEDDVMDDATASGAQTPLVSS